MIAFLYFLVFVQACCIFAMFSIAVAGLSFLWRMRVGNIDSVPGTTLLTLLGRTFGVCAVMAVAFLFVHSLIALIVMTAICVAASLAIAYTTPLPAE
jgi:hypothetical protein